MTVQINEKGVSGVTLAPAAFKHICSELTKRPSAKGVRFSISKTGCSGLAYVVEFVEELTESDLCFEQNKGVKLFVAKTAYPYLKGLQVDYQREGLNYKFTYQNPNQTAECGCGESFTVDERFQD